MTKRYVTSRQRPITISSRIILYNTLALMTETGNLPQSCMLNMWSWKRWTWIEKLNTAWFGRLCYASDVPQLERVYYFIYFLPLFNYFIYLRPRLLLISTTRALYHGENETANEGRLVYSNFRTVLDLKMLLPFFVLLWSINSDYGTDDYRLIPASDFIPPDIICPMSAREN